jgi:hypothetical protein
MLYDWKHCQTQTRLIYGTPTTETCRKASAWLHNVILIACNSRTREHKSKTSCLEGLLIFGELDSILGTGIMLRTGKSEIWIPAEARVSFYRNLLFNGYQGSFLVGWLSSQQVLHSRPSSPQVKNAPQWHGQVQAYLPIFRCSYFG